MRTVAFIRTRATASGENKGEKENLSTPLMNSERLKDFRQAAYNLLGLASYATFELMDAVMTTRNAACSAEFSLNPLFNRQWPSIYEALQDCRPDRKKLMMLYIKQLQQQVPETEHILDLLQKKSIAVLKRGEVCPMPYARRVPHVTEKGYML